MRSTLAVLPLAAPIALAPGAAAPSKDALPEVRVAVPSEVKAEPALEAMAQANS